MSHTTCPKGAYCMILELKLGLKALYCSMYILPRINIHTLVRTVGMRLTFRFSVKYTMVVVPVQSHSPLQLSSILYYNIMHCTVLYCTVLYCTVVRCTVLYCTLKYCHHAVQYKLYCTCAAPCSLSPGGQSSIPCIGVMVSNKISPI